MALGAARMFGIHLPFNFNSPYKARNIQDFWNRWHMTLSRWLREYLYIPLGGNRKGVPRTYVNLFMVFLLGGIWHGAGWTFIAWGTMHGLGSIGFRLWQKWAVPMPRLFATAITFLFVHIGWVFFRAPDLSSAWEMLKKLLGAGLHQGLLPVSNWFLRVSEGLWIRPEKVSGGFFDDHLVFYLIGCCLLVFVTRNSLELALKARLNRPVVAGLLYGLLAWICVLAGIRAVQSPFLYFNF